MLEMSPDPGGQLSDRAFLVPTPALFSRRGKQEEMLLKASEPGAYVQHLGCSLCMHYAPFVTVTRVPSPASSPCSQHTHTGTCMPTFSHSCAHVHSRAHL